MNTPSIIIDGPLGGCTKAENGDPRSYVPSVWAGILDTWDVKSVLDVGCGLGYSCRWFGRHGCEVLGVEGSPDVARQAVVPVVVHDYGAGPLAPAGEFDLCWCSEFVEHVAPEHERNFVADFRQCRLVAMTAAVPGQGGHHHVNERLPAYWIAKMEAHGFRHLDFPSRWLRAVAADAHPYSYFESTGMVFERVD